MLAVAALTPLATFNDTQCPGWWEMQAPHVTTDFDLDTDLLARLDAVANQMGVAALPCCSVTDFKDVIRLPHTSHVHKSLRQ